MPFPLSEHTRDAIARHFRGKGLVWSEAYFLDTLQSSSRRHDIYWSVIALRDCGTPASIPALRDKLHYPMQDVQSTALLTIAHIAGSSETLLYAEALLDPTYRQKGYAMWAIRDAADERAVPAVVDYFRKNRAKVRRGALTSGTVPDVVEYLSRHTHLEAACDALNDIAGLWDALPEGERVEISKRVPAFKAASTPVK